MSEITHKPSGKIFEIVIMLVIIVCALLFAVYNGPSIAYKLLYEDKVIATVNEILQGRGL